MRVPYRLSITLMIALLSGCSSMDTLTKKQMETDGRLEQVLQSIAAQRTAVAELSRELQSIEKRMTALEAGSSALKNETDLLRAQITSKIATDQSPASPSTIQVVNSEAEKQDTEAVQQQAYMKAFGIFSANRYNEAISAFNEFIGAYPASEYAANAQYWIGECHYSQKEYQKALDAFNVVLSHYPQGKKAPDAMLKAAFSQLSLNDHVSARATMHKLIATWPKSPAAVKAKERLNRL